MHPQYTPATISRFWSKVDRRGPDECWVWLAGCYPPTGSRTFCYGKFWNGLRYLGAHAASWEIHYGPIPDGLCVLHNCPGGDNSLCVNPRHLWVGTRGANNTDRAAKGRSAQGERHHQQRLTEESVRAIRVAYAAGNVTQKQLGAQYRVSQVTIGCVLRRETWDHVA